jgi:hypothetical protein
MKNKQENSGVDFVTPIFGLFWDLLSMFWEVVLLASKKLINKFMNKDLPLTQIDRKKLACKKTTDTKEALGIDTNTKKDFYLKDINYKYHSFIVGASGFGKTNLLTILQEYSLREGKPIIFFDPKGDSDALLSFKSLCESYNRKCYIFSEHYQDSIVMNPLLEGTINQVTDRIMTAFDWSEQFYKDAARRSLTHVLNLLKAQNISFSLKSIYEELVKIETKDNIGIITKIEAILTSDFGKYLNGGTHDLTISKIRQEKACLYIGLSTQGYGETAKAVGKLFLGEFMYNSYKSLINLKDPKEGLNNPVSVYFDEFGALVVPDFIELQNKCRGAGIEITVAVQTAADIDRVDPALTRQIIENAANHFILKQRLSDAAALFSESIGTIIAKKQTYRIEDGNIQNMGSEREVHELVVHPDVIKNLNIGQCVLLRQGPTRVNLINIRSQKVDRPIEVIKAVVSKPIISNPIEAERSDYEY